MSRRSTPAETDRGTDDFLRYKIVLVLLMLAMMAAVILWAPPAVSRHHTCNECDEPIEAEEKVRWSKWQFCSEMCKEDFVERYQEEHKPECRICREEVQLPGTVQHNGGMTFIVVGNTWDGYCKKCRQDIHDGLIDKKGRRLDADATVIREEPEPQVRRDLPDALQDPLGQVREARQAAEVRAEAKSVSLGRWIGLALLVLIPVVLFFLWRGI